MAITQAYMTSSYKFGTMFMTPDGKTMQRNTTPSGLVPMVLAQGHPLGQDSGPISPHDMPRQNAPGLNPKRAV